MIPPNPPYERGEKIKKSPFTRGIEGDQNF